MLKIYMCAFKNKCYLKEAKICIESLRTNGKFNGLIYLFTDMDVIIPNVKVIKANNVSIPLSAGFRTRVFDYIKDYDSNDIFLYLDTDIVVLKPLPSFDFIGDKIQVYGYPSRTQNCATMCGFITNDPYYTKHPAICSGILLFRPSLKVKNVFDEIDKMYNELIKTNKINSCWEQPTLCFKLIEHDMQTISLNEYVYEERTKKSATDLHVFNHFCGLRGETRYIEMKKYLDNSGKNATNIYKRWQKNILLV